MTIDPQFDNSPDRASALLSTYTAKAKKLAELPVDSARAMTLRRELADLAEEIEYQARFAHATRN
jgi:hypothetical protein